MNVSIIVTGYNVENYLEDCIKSIAAQTVKPVDVLVYNDASTDNTDLLLNNKLKRDYKNTFKNGFFCWNAEENEGALAGRYKLSKLAQGDIIAFLGADDMLAVDAVETVIEAYKKPGIKLTYGSWVALENGQIVTAKPYPEEVFKNKSFRRSAWRATALNTFKADLLARVPLHVLMNKEGRFYKNCTDLAFSFPCLELCKPEEVAVITKPIYIYRSNHSNTTLNRLGKANKTKVREELKRIKPLENVQPV